MTHELSSVKARLHGPVAIRHHHPRDASLRRRGRPLPAVRGGRRRPHPVPIEELAELTVPPLEHANYLPPLPVVEGQALDVARAHAHAAMSAAAPEAQGYPVRHRRPGSRGGVAAVVTARVAGERVDEAQARGGERSIGLLLLLPPRRIARGGAARTRERTRRRAATAARGGAHPLELRCRVAQEAVVLRRRDVGVLRRCFRSPRRSTETRRGRRGGGKRRAGWVERQEARRRRRRRRGTVVPIVGVNVGVRRHRIVEI